MNVIFHRNLFDYFKKSKKMQTAQDPDAYESDTTATELVEFEDMTVGMVVEVFWEGEKAWFEGEVTDINHELREFEVHYKQDAERLWHKPEWYSVRNSY